MPPENSAHLMALCESSASFIKWRIAICAKYSVFLWEYAIKTALKYGFENKQQALTAGKSRYVIKRDRGTRQGGQVSVQIK